MKRLFSAVIAAMIMFGSAFNYTSPASAQMGHTAAFNCTMLGGSPFLCVKNESSAPIIAIQAVAPGFGWYNPTAWLTIPGGGIMPGGAAVVKFPVFSHGAIQNIVVRTADGQIHFKYAVNVVNSTSLTVSW